MNFINSESEVNEMKTRKIWVIYIMTDKGWKEHSRTSDKFESMKIFGALQKAGVKVNTEEQYF